MTAAYSAPHVAAAGAITALGPTLRHTALFLRAGQDHVVQSPFIDALGEHVAMNATSTLPADLIGSGRLGALAARACCDALSVLHDPASTSPRLCLVLPQRFVGRAADLSVVEATVRDALPEPLSTAPVDYIYGGGAAGARALAQASQLLTQPQTDSVLVCAVDSYYEWAMLEPLLAADQLLTADNVDGRRPGEAAAALLLTDNRHFHSRQYGCCVAAATLGKEPIALGSEEPSTGVGVTEAFETLNRAVSLANGSVPQFLVDTTHEAYRIRELQIMLARFGRLMSDEFELLLPARELGEVGATTLILYAALVAEATRRGFEPALPSLMFGGSEEIWRGAVLMVPAR